MKQTLFKPLLFLGSLLLLSGCGKSVSTDTADSSASYNSSTTTESASGDYGWSADPEEIASETEAGEGETQTADLSISDESMKDQASRKLIKTVSLSMETQAFDEMKNQLEETIASYGGYIESSDYYIPTGVYSQNRSYYVTVRIPSEQLDAFTATVGDLGTITNKSEYVEDVTLDYVDKEAYLESIQAEYDRVLELLEEAADLDQILALESKLSDLRYEINSYESRLRTYDNLIDYSTVHISISEVEHVTDVQPTAGSRIRSGFRDSLLSIRDFFVNLAVFLLANLPVLLLLAVFVVLIVIIIKKVLKKIKNKDPKNKAVKDQAAKEQTVKDKTTKDKDPDDTKNKKESV